MSNQRTKTCIGCQHFDSATEHCKHDKHIDLIFGTPKYSARWMRQDGKPCGPRGRLWAEKPQVNLMQPHRILQLFPIR